MERTFVIAEIGQNHNGSVEIARKIIDIVAKNVVDSFTGKKLPGFDAIKLTKRDLAEELSEAEYNKPYLTPHSFGKTYGEHREFLELSEEQHYELYQYAKSKGLKVVETLCARGCLNLLNYFKPDYLKVASRDLTNLPLLDAMAETKIPMILSTGMAGKKELDDALEVITRHHENVAILHCLSQYPAEYENINLRSIHYLQKHYGKFTIGYSDHSIGIVVPVVAVGMGARVIEKHVTLDRNMKGTDHKGSLGPEGMYRFIRDLRNVEDAMGEEDIFISPSVKETQKKLERSVATLRAIKKGEVIGEGDVHLLSPGDGFKWAERHLVVGKKARRDLKKDEIIYPDDIENGN